MKRTAHIESGLVTLAAVAILLAPCACGGLGKRPAASQTGGKPVGETGGSGAGGEVGIEAGAVASTGGAAGMTGGTEFALVGAPLPFAPTKDGFGLSAVLAKGDPSLLSAQVRAAGAPTWEAAVLPEVRSTDIAQWAYDGLLPGTRYDYEILAPIGGGNRVLYAGSAVTQRLPGDSFTFAIITDSHIGADLSYSNQGNPNTLRRVSAEAGEVSPDFLVNLGDMLDFHQYGFNDPPPTGSIARSAYLNYRTLLGDTLGRTAHFGVIGNWEGENGCYTAEEITRSQQQRMLYLPGPSPATYPQGGSPAQDYYAFAWGDALFVVLNVMGYTSTEHLLSSNPGLPDDWTLGEAQYGWFADTLANATSKWRFVMIHHTVGGAAGDFDDSAYGRGGGQAAYVGEQAKVHQLMRQYGVQIFFYGHDHVFADMQVDGIHYTLPGSAGAIWLFGQSQTGYTQSWLESGFSRVTVSPSSVDVQLMKMGGGVLYEYSLP